MPIKKVVNKKENMGSILPCCRSDADQYDMNSPATGGTESANVATTIVPTPHNDSYAKVRCRRLPHTYMQI